MQYLAPILTIIFVTLKVTDHLDWSWVWVLSPLWIAAIIWGMVILATFSIFASVTSSTRRGF